MVLLKGKGRAVARSIPVKCKHRQNELNTACWMREVAFFPRRLGPGAGATAGTLWWGLVVKETPASKTRLGLGEVKRRGGGLER